VYIHIKIIFLRLVYIRTTKSLSDAPIGCWIENIWCLYQNFSNFLSNSQSLRPTNFFFLWNTSHIVSTHRAKDAKRLCIWDLPFYINRIIDGELHTWRCGSNMPLWSGKVIDGGSICSFYDCTIEFDRENEVAYLVRVSYYLHRQRTLLLYHRRCACRRMFLWQSRIWHQDGLVSTPPLISLLFVKTFKRSTNNSDHLHNSVYFCAIYVLLFN